MNNELFRIVYCSRNRVGGDADSVSRELRNILSKARSNNERVQVTGALVYTSGSFAQVLEGPLPEIEKVFERIQRDPRHSDVTVVEIGPIAERQFPEWSMAFAGSSSVDGSPEAIEAFDAVFSKSARGGDQILSILQELVEGNIDWVLQDAA